MSSARRELQTSILDDETVVFFPTYGHYDPVRGLWTVHIHGWVFDDRTGGPWRQLTLRLLCRLMGVEPQHALNRIFRERSRAFLVNNARGKRLSIRLGTKQFELARTSAAGHFRGKLELTRGELAGLISGDSRLPVQLVLRPGDARSFGGAVHLVDRQGISVVSDIDDTVKLTQVSNRRLLLANTFLKDFEAVPGMAEMYRRWADAGAVFHYVSASPWQLFEPLVSFLERTGFPTGTFHLKDFRPKNMGLLKLLGSPRRAKLRVLHQLVGSFPDRRFILVGDSGQADPEIYGRLARRYPEQILAIFIRNITEESVSGRRIQRAFVGVPPNRWRLFYTADELEGFRLPLIEPVIEGAIALAETGMAES